MSSRVLYLVGCAAAPVQSLHEACHEATRRGWTPHVILTPTAAKWVDLAVLSRAVAGPIRVRLRRPDEPDPLPPADALLVAPATFNTINKWAAGINDTTALGVLNELLVEDVPVAVVPWVKTTMQTHAAYAEAIIRLRQHGAAIWDSASLIGSDGQPQWGKMLDHFTNFAHPLSDDNRR